METPFRQILEALDSTIANTIDKLDEAITYGEYLSDEEFDIILKIISTH